ncbi:MAG: type II toxin-antitoxin system VapC family toxin [Nitrospira sp.]|nr:type II toxin-antitoxin system VapC family toxin [Nitrospira sp.]
MTRLLLDTSVYIAAKKNLPAAAETLAHVDEIVVTPIVLGELRAGFLQGSKTETNERELRAFLDSPRVTIPPLDEETAGRYAIIRTALKKAGTPISTNDIWIAASAMQYGLPILTSDADFKKIPQVIVHHFSPA